MVLLLAVVTAALTGTLFILTRRSGRWRERLEEVIMVMLGTSVGFFLALLAGGEIDRRATVSEYASLLAGALVEAGQVRLEASDAAPYLSQSGEPSLVAGDPTPQTLSLLTSATVTYQHGSAEFRKNIHLLRRMAPNARVPLVMRNERGYLEFRYMELMAYLDLVEQTLIAESRFILEHRNETRASRAITAALERYTAKHRDEIVPLREQWMETVISKQASS